MKKIILMLGLASAMSAFTGCTKDEPVAPEAVGATEYTIASVIADGVTRTELNLETLKLEWKAGDEIKIFTGDNMAFTSFKTAAGDGFFTGAVQPVQTSKASYVAVYPDGKFQNVYDPDQSTSVDALRISIPQNQYYTAGKGPRNVIPMVGIWQDGDQSVLFKPVGSALKLPIYVGVEGTKLTSVAFSFSGNVGAGEIALKDWSADEFGDYSDPTLRYVRTDFLYGELGRILTVTGDILPGTTPETAADVYAAVSPGDYKGGYTVTITDSEGATMTRKKAASTTIVALQPGTVQSIAPLKYVQKAPNFTITEDPTDNTIITATLDAGQTLEEGTTYKYWLESVQYGKWGSASNKVTIAAADYATFQSVTISDMTITAWTAPTDGETMHFVIEATAADGSVYKRVYDYTYHKAAASGITINDSYWDSVAGACLLYFSAGEDQIKNANAGDVEFSLEGGQMPFEEVRTLSDLTASGAAWHSDFTGSYLQIPFSAFGLPTPIPTGNYTLKVTIYDGWTVLTTASTAVEVY